MTPITWPAITWPAPQGWYKTHHIHMLARSRRRYCAWQVDEAAVSRYRLHPSDPKATPSSGSFNDPSLYTPVLYTSASAAAHRSSVLVDHPVTQCRRAAVVYPDGSCVRYRGDIREYFVSGDGPAYVSGTRLEQWQDDGSEKWACLYATTEVHLRARPEGSPRAIMPNDRNRLCGTPLSRVCHSRVCAECWKGDSPLPLPHDAGRATACKI